MRKIILALALCFSLSGCIVIYDSEHVEVTTDQKYKIGL